MPQTTIDVQVTDTGDTKLITAKIGDQILQSILFPSEVQTVNDLAEWLLAQTGRDQITDPALQKRLTIDYHIEQTTDPETGDPVDQTVIDSVQSEPLPQDDGKANFSALPGWATWTANEAETWITDNVTDLASAKIALKAMAKAIIFLRNVTID